VLASWFWVRLTARWTRTRAVIAWCDLAFTACAWLILYRVAILVYQLTHKLFSLFDALLLITIAFFHTAQALIEWRFRLIVVSLTGNALAGTTVLWINGWMILAHDRFLLVLIMRCVWLVAIRGSADFCPN
jgi:hypothetical protein